MEAACDEKVIERMDKEGIAGYSETLLFCSVRRRRVTACPVAFGETNVKERVSNVLNYKKPSFWIMGTAVAVCIIAAVSFLTDPVQTQASMSADERISIIGGADGPTSIFFAGKLGDHEEDSLVDESMETMIETLYGLKTQSSEDAQAIGSIIFELFVMNLVPKTDVTHYVEKTEDGAVLTLEFEDTFLTVDEILDERKLPACGNILLALVEDLSEVRFICPAEEKEDNGPVSVTLYWDIEAADASLPEGDVKSYRKTLSAFKKLFEEEIEIGEDLYISEGTE